MNATELKYQHEINQPDSRFFDRKTMRFFGDRMSNYGVRDYEDCWELYRRRPVNHGVSKSAYFDKETFARVFPEEN